MVVQSESKRQRPPGGVPAGSSTVVLMRRPPLWRRLLAWLLLLLFCLAAPLALLAGWGRWAIASPDRFVATVHPAADDPRLQDAVVRAVRDHLPGNSARLGARPAESFAIPLRQTSPAGPTATAIPPERAIRRASSTTTPTPPLTTPTSSPRAATPIPPATLAPATGSPAPPVVRQAATPELVATPITVSSSEQPGAPPGAVERYVASPAFATAWDETTRETYASLRDAGSSAPLAVDFAPILPGLSAALGTPLPAAAADLRVEVLDGPTTGPLRRGLDRLDWLAIVLPVLSLLLLIGTLWIGPGTLRWLGRLGLGLALAMIVLLLVLLLGAPVVTSRVPDALGAVIGRALLDTLLWQPVLLAAALVAGGLAVAIIAGLAGWLVAGRRTRA